MAERTDDFTPRDDERDLGVTKGDEEERTEQETAEIRAEIRETRERMGDTLEQLGERLSPSTLKENVKQDIRDATIGKVEKMAQNAADRADDARRTMMDTIRENPIPAAMVGVGLGWLVYNARQQSSHSSGRFTSRGRAETGRAGGYERGGYGTSGYVGGYAAGRTGAQSDAGYAWSTEHEVPGSTDEGAIDRVRDKARELAGDVREKASDVASRAQAMAGNIAEDTRHGARRVEDQFRESPLTVGAAALALGLVAGLAVPETRKEKQLMGGARDRLIDRARDVARDTTQKVEHVAERVADEAQSTAKQAAREEGLTAS